MFVQNMKMVEKNKHTKQDKLITKGLIPAAGKGMRMYPKNVYAPKSMLDVGGKPIIQRNIEIMRDEMGIKEIFIIIGHLGEKIKKYFGDGNKFGVKIHYLKNELMEYGPLGSIYAAKNCLKEPFVCILGDEVYINSNHGKIQDFIKKHKDFEIICAIKETSNPEKIKKNYSVEIKKEKILSINEKPQKIINDFVGCGTYIFTPTLFNYLEQKIKKSEKEPLILMKVLNELTVLNKKTYAFKLQGDYLNVNNIEDKNMANYMIRSQNFKKYSIAVIIPALNEEQTIGRVIRDFKKNKYIKKIIVVNTNSRDKTNEIAKSEGAEVITKDKLIGGKKILPGYGDKLKYGMDICDADIMILVEADGTFKSKDVPKILEYMKDADIVVGTRTTRQMIEQGANMNWFLRWGVFGQDICHHLK